MGLRMMTMMTTMALISHLQPAAHNGTNGAATIVEERKLRVCPEVIVDPTLMT